MGWLPPGDCFAYIGNICVFATWTLAASLGAMLCFACLLGPDSITGRLRIKIHANWLSKRHSGMLERLGLRVYAKWKSKDLFTDTGKLRDMYLCCLFAYSALAILKEQTNARNVNCAMDQRYTSRSLPVLKSSMTCIFGKYVFRILSLQFSMKKQICVM